MNNELNTLVNTAKESWANIDIDSIFKIKSHLINLTKNEMFCSFLKEIVPGNPKGVELYRDSEHGFVLLAYEETQGIYRMPHNHGNGWVIYVVLAGAIDMGSYAHLTSPNNTSKLILKKMDHLKNADGVIYYPGEIHDTNCVSEKAIILRFTSCDLKEEDKQGRMMRFKI